MIYKVRRFNEMNSNGQYVNSINESIPPFVNTNIKPMEEKLMEVNFNEKPYWFVTVGLQLEYANGIVEIQSYTEKTAEEYYNDYKEYFDIILPADSTVKFVEKIQPML